MIAKLRVIVPDKQYLLISFIFCCISSSLIALMYFGGEIIYGVVDLKVQAKLKLSGVHLFIVGRNKGNK